MPTPALAANAYASLARVTAGAGGLASAAGESVARNGTDFAGLLKQAMDGVAAASRKSDAAVGAVAAGRANLIDVVTAVAEAETAVSALVAVRDNVIQSYQEVMRMTI
jgi:flagellar hook-basal body complex protein FliE